MIFVSNMLGWFGLSPFPVIVTTRITRFFSRGSLWTFICHYCWEGTNPSNMFTFVIWEVLWMINFEAYSIHLYTYRHLKGIWQRISTTGKAGIRWGEYLTSKGFRPWQLFVTGCWGCAMSLLLGMKAWISSKCKHVCKENLNKRSAKYLSDVMLISWFKYYSLNENTIQYAGWILADCGRLDLVEWDIWFVFNMCLFLKRNLDMCTELGLLNRFPSRVFDHRNLRLKNMLIVTWSTRVSSVRRTIHC